MRIAISADTKNGLDSVISPHFGRCPHFILVDLEGQEVKTVSELDNPYYSRHQPGQVPAFINNHSVNVMLTGGMGGRAIASFRQFDIEAVTGAAGTVRQSLERYLGGSLEGAAPCRESVRHGHDHGDDGAYEKDEIGRLREEADMLRKQLEDAESRLGALDN